MIQTIPHPQEIPVQDLVPTYKFIKVEEYFRDYQKWHKLDHVIAYHFDSAITLSLTFARHDGQNCVMLVQFPRKDSIRIRFNPN